MRKHHFQSRLRRVLLAALLVFVPILGVIKLNLSTSAATTDPAGYTYQGNVGNVTSSWATNGDLVNPTMATHGVGSSLLYVYCDSTDMPYATGGLISAQATPSDWRTIVIFIDNGDGTYSYKSMVTVQMAGAGITYNNAGVPLGFTADSSGNIYMTSPVGYLIARYTSDSSAPTVSTPTLMGPMTGFWQQTVNGKPSLDTAGDYILVPGQFQVQAGTYAVAHVNLSSGDPVNDAPTLVIPYPTNGDQYWMETIASNNDGVHFAGGSFMLGGLPFNIVQSNPNPGVDTVSPISPPNISGINNEQQAGLYNIYSISVDDASNIYVTGNFGVTANGQYSEASILKIDQHGNFVTLIAPETNLADTLGPVKGTNAVTINRENQWVFVVDSNNTSGSAVKIFAFNGAPPGETAPPCGPPTSVNVNTDNGTVSVVSPNDGSLTTISNQTQETFEQGLPPTAAMAILPDGIVNGGNVTITTSLVDLDTAQIITTSWLIEPDGTVQMVLRDGSGEVRAGTAAPVSNSDGSTTTTVNLLSPNGTTLNNVVTVADNSAGGKTITTTKIIDEPGGPSYTTVTTISSDSNGEISISLTLPDIETGESYVTTVSTNNGAQACNLASIPWTAGESVAFITLSQSYCSNTPFDIDIQPTTSGIIGMDCATFTTATNNPTGYTTTLSATEANLTCTTDSGTYNLTQASALARPLANNQWGYNVGWTSPLDFQGVPTTPTTIQSSSTSAVGDQFMFWIGARVNYDQPPCTYEGQITITALMNAVPAPTIDSISPTSGSVDGADVITITGSGFGTAQNPNVSGISVGDTSCAFIAIVDDTTATCVSPPMAAGTYDVTVTGFGGSATLPDSFTYTSGGP